MTHRVATTKRSRFRFIGEAIAELKKVVAHQTRGCLFNIPGVDCCHCSGSNSGSL